jgi:hypothetical protein
VDFAWWPNKVSKTVASYRIRCLQTIEELNRRGVSAGHYQPGDEAPKALVLSKRYDPESMAHASELRAKHGTRIALDLCDNHFTIPGQDPKWIARAEVLKRAVGAADLVTSSSETLAGIIRDACPGAKVAVIGEAVELPHTSSVLERAADPRAELEYWALKSALAGEGRRRFIWFGNHGAEYAHGGMVDLERIYPLLEQLDRELPLQLTILSNSRDKYQQVVRNWRIKTHYLRWRPSTYSRALAMHELCVLPITDNLFTRCKTNNRVASALLHGVPVVADSIPAYEPFAEAIVLNDWEGGARLLLNDRAEAQRRIAIGTEILNRDWALPKITDQWHATLRELIAA